MRVKQSAEMNKLLMALRDNLRSELGAKPVSDRVVWLRVSRKEDPVQKATPEDT
jgi:hypothetical protein